jgi:uncharacterized protein YndB with AHSA1/START domain
MKSESNPVVRVIRRIPFPAERVFDAWLNPAFTAKWLFATPGGQMIRAEADPRVGGRFTYTERRGNDDVEHTGEYLEIDRPRRLVFTFGVPKFSPNMDRITVEIEPLESECRLTLTHEMKREFSEFFGKTRDGWTNIVEALAATLGDKRAAANREPAQFTAPGEARLVRLLPGPIERVWDYLTDGEKRKKWFAGGAMELRVGGRANLHFRHADIAPDEKPPEKYAQYHDPGATMPVEITQCEPPRLLAFTWLGDNGARTSEAIFELTPEGDDVRLVLTHRHLASDEERANVSAGWHLHTAVLTALLTGDTPPPFWPMHSRLEARYAKMLEARA